MQHSIGRSKALRMLYSAKLHNSNLYDRPADVFPRCEALSAASEHKLSDTNQLGTNQIGTNQILDAKEAHSIGMTRGYPHQHSPLSFRLPCGFCLPSGSLALLLALFAALGLASLTPSAYAQSASSWNNRGQKAELREDYDAAYEAYLHAHKKKPADMRYTARLDRMRFQAAAMHVDRGRVLRQSGDLAGALNQFTRALEIDPGNEAAEQEIIITKRLDQPANSGSGPGASASPSGLTDSGAAIDAISAIGAPLELKPISNDPITLHMVEDSKAVYQAICKASGLNVLFDPDFVSKRIPIDLTNVGLDDALRIVGMVSNTFYKPVTKDTIFVAANTHTKHQDLDDLAIQTFYLTNPSLPADANEVHTAIRNMLPADAKTYLVPSQNAIVVRATPDQLTLVQKLINDLDRTKAEVVVDVAILEVNRDKIHNLGISLPQSFSLTPQADNSTSTTSGSTTTDSSFTLNTLANMNATNFAVTLGGGTLNALLSDSDTRVLQNPSIRATDGQNAVMKIGSKIPIATGSSSSTLTSTAVSTTQFQYIDVGVNIDMTPTIHMDREISLKLSVEVSSESGNVTIDDVTEPIISQRSDKTVIQLKDGEPCLLAGLLSKDDSYSNSGTPGLAQIPLLKYLFSTIKKENQQDEIVFILIPHIVRESVLTHQNMRAIDTGTSTTIELRRATPEEALFDNTRVASPAQQTSETSAANAAAAMVQHMKQQVLPPTPPTPTGSRAAVQPAATLATAAKAVDASNVVPVTLTVLPLNSTQTVGNTFRVPVLLANARDIFSVPMELQYDPKILQLVNVDSGGLLGGDGQAVALVHRDNGAGLVSISASRPPGAAGVNGVNGQGEVCILTFKAIASGDSNLTLTKVAAMNSQKISLPAIGSQSVVHVK